jgi:chorismate mutase
MCVRVLVMLNTERTAKEMKFVYLHRAAEIRADLERLRDQSGHSMTSDRGLD